MLGHPIACFVPHLRCLSRSTNRDCAVISRSTSPVRGHACLAVWQRGNSMLHAALHSALHRLVNPLLSLGCDAAAVNHVSRRVVPAVPPVAPARCAACSHPHAVRTRAASTPLGVARRMARQLCTAQLRCNPCRLCGRYCATGVISTQRTRWGSGVLRRCTRSCQPVPHVCPLMILVPLQLGMTPLFRAAEAWDLDIVDELLGAGADINSPSKVSPARPVPPARVPQANTSPAVSLVFAWLWLPAVGFHTAAPDCGKWHDASRLAPDAPRR